MDNDSIGRTFKSLLSEVDNAFVALTERYPAEVRCGPGCDDCCHAVFSISMVEAFFIERHLRSRLFAEDPELFERLARRAEDFQKERELREKEMPLVENNQASIEHFGKWRIRCPMLEEDKRCSIYQLRPLTCRAYGLPLSINGSGHVCGLSGFSRGKDYPTIKMEKIHGYLLGLSEELAAERGLSPDRASIRIFLYEVIVQVAAGRPSDSGR